MSTGTPFVPGAAVAPNAILVRLVAESGEAQVWLAHDDGETEVVVKLLRGPLALRAGQRAVERLEVAATIASPHVPRIQAAALTVDGLPYVIMDHCPGESLRARLQRQRRLTLDEAARLVSQLGEALSCAHACAVVHGSVRPEHVLVQSSAGAAKLVGFASTRLLSEAPSAARGSGDRPVGSTDRSAWDDAVADDLWSLGALAYQSLSGVWAFDDSTSPAFAAPPGAFDPPSHHGLPPELDAFFERAFAPDARQRHRSARDLAVAFTHAVQIALSAQSARAAFIAAEIVSVEAPPVPPVRALAPDAGDAAPPVADQPSSAGAPAARCEAGVGESERAATRPGFGDPAGGGPADTGAAHGDASRPGEPPGARASERGRALDSTSPSRAESPPPGAALPVVAEQAAAGPTSPSAAETPHTADKAACGAAPLGPSPVAASGSVAVRRVVPVNAGPAGGRAVPITEPVAVGASATPRPAEAVAAESATVTRPAVAATLVGMGGARAVEVTRPSERVVRRPEPHAPSADVALGVEVAVDGNGQARPGTVLHVPPTPVVVPTVPSVGVVRAAGAPAARAPLPGAAAAVAGRAEPPKREITPHERPSVATTLDMGREHEAPAARPDTGARPWEMRAGRDDFWGGRFRPSDPAVAPAPAAGAAITPPPRAARRSKPWYLRFLWMWIAAVVLLGVGLTLVIVRPWAKRRPARPTATATPLRPPPSTTPPPTATPRLPPTGVPPGR